MLVCHVEGGFIVCGSRVPFYLVNVFVPLGFALLRMF